MATKKQELVVVTKTVQSAAHVAEFTNAKGWAEYLMSATLSVHGSWILIFRGPKSVLAPETKKG